MNAFFEWQDAPLADFAVIGDPVSHSLSPKMHAAAYAALGLPYRYVAVRVAPGSVAEALNHLGSLGYIGVNVTVPHKEEALQWCAAPDPFALKVRAANTLRLTDRSGINTDAPGFLDTLSQLGLTKGTVLLLGAGGTARALALALSDAGWRIRLFNRTAAKATVIAEELNLNAEVISEPDPVGADLILNTTSASLQQASLGIRWERASSHAVAYDVMYSHQPTLFMAEAASFGLRTCDGAALLAAQGARAFSWWLGLPPPYEPMREALRP